MKTLKKLTVLSAAAGLVATATADELQQSFDLGATYTKGNSDSLLVTLGYTATKKEAKDEYAASLFYTYGENSSATTNDEILADASWNHLYSDRFYVGSRFDFRMDSLADIDYRARLSVTAGYYLVKEDNFTLSFEGGVGVTAEKVGSVASEYFHGYVGENAEYKLSDKTRLYQSLGVFAPLDNFDNYQLIAEAGIETSLSDKLSLKIYFQDKYDAQPAAGSKQNDFRMVTGISYKF